MNNPEPADAAPRTPTASTAPLTEEEKQALKHAWDWFALHSAQRMQALHYYVLTMALLVAGYGAAIKDANSSVGLAIAILGVVFSLGFRGMDRRTRDLVRVGEEALKPLQKKLAEKVGEGSLELAQIADRRPSPLGITYSKLIAFLQWSAVVGFATAALYAGFRR